MNKIKRLAIIPARLGSKRIKKKNIRLFYGKPIISYPITELKKKNIFDKIFVSTESKSIKLISEKFGASVDFLRPKKLSGDNIPLKDVLKNTLSIFDELGEIYDEIWLVYACNPLIKKEDFIKAKPFREIADEWNISPAKLAHKYALSIQGPSSVILGVKNREELAECVKAEEEERLTPIEIKTLEDLF